MKPAPRGKGQPGHVDRTKGGNRVARMFWLDKDVDAGVDELARQRLLDKREIVELALRSYLRIDASSG